MGAFLAALASDDVGNSSRGVLSIDLTEDRPARVNLGIRLEGHYSSPAA